MTSACFSSSLAKGRCAPPDGRSTIARRLAAFEASFGGPPLFDRVPEGLRLNAAGEQLISAAEGIEDAVLTLERRSAAASPVLSGTVRVSTGECAAGFLARCLSEATTTALPPGITLELVDELRQTANLVRRQADMALRHEPPEGGTSTFPRRAPSPARSTGGAMLMLKDGSPIPTSKRTMRLRVGSSGRWERRGVR